MPDARIKPNVVFILADDLGMNDIALYGSKFYETPNIDGLAKRCMKCNQAYSASPLCSLARLSGSLCLARGAAAAAYLAGGFA